MDAEIRKKILALLDHHRIMTIATLRPDGWPQATTVGYVNDGLTLYFLCDTPQLMEITGLSMAARAQAVTDRAEAEKVLALLPTSIPSRPRCRSRCPSPRRSASSA